MLLIGKDVEHFHTVIGHLYFFYLLFILKFSILFCFVSFVLSILSELILYQIFFHSADLLLTLLVVSSAA